jgi:hypothetical protein
VLKPILNKEEQMKNLKMQLILVAVLFSAIIAGAEPVGTEFTYQGRLIDANSPADGEYDFIFRLYDAVSDGNQAGEDVNIPDVDVIDGYFTVELDFVTGIFVGDARWLQISVRPGASIDPNDFVTLNPLQELTPAPYALYALESGGSGGDDGDWIIDGNNILNANSGTVAIGGITEAYPQPKLLVYTDTDQAAVWGWAANPDLNSYGLYGLAVTGSAGTNYGVYGWGINPGGGDAYAGYFQGDVGITGKLTADADAELAPDDDDNIAIGDAVDDDKKLYLSSDSDDYGIYSTIFKSSGANTAIYGSVSGYTPEASYGVVGEGGNTNGDNYGVYGKATGPSSTDNNYGVFGEVTSLGRVGNYGVYGKADIGNPGGNYGIYGYGRNSGMGDGWAGYFDGNLEVAGDAILCQGEDNEQVIIGSETPYTPNTKVSIYANNQTIGLYVEAHEEDDLSSSCGVYGTSTSPLCYNYGVKGVVPAYSTTFGYAIYGEVESGEGAAWAGYFVGDVMVHGTLAAETLVDMTPYPKDLAAAYEAVMSMERLPEGQYDENNKQMQLDHSILSDFVRSEDGHRDLSATVSCQNEVIKDLIKQNKELTERLEALEQKVSGK